MALQLNEEILANVMSHFGIIAFDGLLNPFDRGQAVSQPTHDLVGQSGKIARTQKSGDGNGTRSGAARGVPLRLEQIVDLVGSGNDRRINDGWQNRSLTRSQRREQVGLFTLRVWSFSRRDGLRTHATMSRLDAKSVDR